jgi:DNA-binding response OmpR family regulator
MIDKLSEKSDSADLKILIVDDAPENIDILAEALGGYKKMIATNGEKALEIANGENQPDLILLDIMMPGMDGYEVCKKLKENEKTKKIPVIFLTAKTSESDIIKGFRLGAQDYVTKPFNQSELLARVDTHLKLKESLYKLESVNQFLEEKVEQRTEELKNALNQVEEVNQRLLKVDKSAAEFLEMMSKEIRQPLNNIMGAVEQLKAKVDSSDLITLINFLDSTVTKFEEFTSTAIQITFIRSNASEIKMAEIHVKQFIEFCLLENSDDLNKKNIKISQENISSGITLNCNEDLLMKLFSIVISSISSIFEQDSRIDISSVQSESETRIELTGLNPTALEPRIEEMESWLKWSDEAKDSRAQFTAELVNLILELHHATLEVKKSGESEIKITLNFCLA